MLWVLDNFWDFTFSCVMEQSTKYVDQILPNFHHLPPSNGELWTYNLSTLNSKDQTWIFYSHCYFTRLNPIKKGPFLVLPSSIGRNSSAPNAKIFFQIHREILEGWKIAKMALFNPCMEFKIILGKIDALWKFQLVIFSQKCPKLRPIAF